MRRMANVNLRPKSGIYRARVTYPEHLREILKGTGTTKTLQTRNVSLARNKVIPLLTAFDYLSQFLPDMTAGIRLVAPALICTLIRRRSWRRSGLLARTSQRVHFADPYQRKDISRLITAVDRVVVPSIWWENSPLVIQGAFAQRRLVICSNIGGMAKNVR